MLNQIVLVGRLVRKPELRESENNSKYAYITLAVPRSFKNSNGEYDTDFIDCILWDAAASNTVEYCNKGDIVGIRGRIQSRKVETEAEHKETIVDIVCERVSCHTVPAPGFDSPRWWCCRRWDWCSAV